MRVVQLLLLLLVLLFINDLYAAVGDDMATATSVVKSGIEATNAIAEIVEGVKVLAKFSKFLGKIAPFLAAIGPIMDIITIFLPKQEDPTLKYLKEQFSKVDSNFRNMERLFGEVTNLVRQKGLNAQFSTIEQNIHALSHRLHMLMTAPTNAVEGQKSRFIKAFETSYHSAANKIYNAIMKKQSFTDNIPKEAIEYTKNDRKKVQKIMTGSLALLLSAVKVNLAYLELTNRKGSYEQEKKLWDQRIKEVSQKIKTVDTEVTNNYATQRMTDLKYLSAQYKGDSHDQFAHRLYTFYQEKYYWRDWAVLVYNKMAKSWTGHNGHNFNLCGGDEYLQKDGRNVITSSVPKTKRSINHWHYTYKLSGVQTENVVWGVHYCWTTPGVMNQIKNWSGHDVCMQAVISDRESVRVRAAPGRLAAKWKYFYNMYVFG
jgi:predicted  nucleic acid-binding Zn-ribbon protein